MKTEIIAFSLGLTSCYLIIGKEIVMVDAGGPHKLNHFKKILAKNRIDPARIKLIVITHSHFDHCGSACDIRDLTGAKIAIHESERECVEHTKVMVPIGVNWKVLIDRGVAFVYPGHGKPFPVDVNKRRLEFHSAN